MKTVKVHRQTKWMTQKVLIKCLLPLTLFLMETILFKIVDVSELIDQHY